MKYHPNFFSFLSTADKLRNIQQKEKDLPLRTGQIHNFPTIWEKYVNARKNFKCWLDNLKAPISVAIDLTYRCNLKCPYCYLNASERINSQDFPKAKIFNVIDELSKMDVISICLCGGEPTLHKDLLEIVEYVLSKKLSVNMVSNGTLIIKEYASKLADAGIGTVQISLDGSKPEIMDSLRGNGTFNKALNAIQNLRDNDIITLVSFSSTKVNVHDFPNVVSLCSKLGVASVRTMYLVPEIPAHEQLILDDREYAWLIKWIHENSLKYPLRIEFGDPTEHIIIGKYTSTLLFAITPTGHILLTPYFNFSYGCIDDGIQQLWNDGLESIWKKNLILLTLSKFFKTEKDFLKLQKISVTRNKEEKYINLRGMSQNEIAKISNSVKEVLSNGK